MESLEGGSRSEGASSPSLSSSASENKQEREQFVAKLPKRASSDEELADDGPSVSPNKNNNNDPVLVEIDLDNVVEKNSEKSSSLSLAPFWSKRSHKILLALGLALLCAVVVTLVFLLKDNKSTTSAPASSPSETVQPGERSPFDDSDPSLSPSSSPTSCPMFPSAAPLPGKKGIGMTLRETGEQGSWNVNMPKIIKLSPHWNYSWGLNRVQAQPEDIEFLPMVFGGWVPKDNLESKLKELADSGKVKHILGFNEPDSKRQGNTAVSRAIELWPSLESVNLPLVSPSCATQDLWMEEFMAEAEKDCLRVDWVGIHWYGGASAESFKKKMLQYYEEYGRRPLLITEFAPADWTAKTPADNRHSQAQVLAFMKEVLPWLEQQDWIAGYAWFPFAITKAVGTSSALFDEQGELTALGRFYASVRNDNPYGDQSIVVD